MKKEDTLGLCYITEEVKDKLETVFFRGYCGEEEYRIVGSLGMKDGRTIYKLEQTGC